VRVAANNAGPDVGLIGMFEETQLKIQRVKLIVRLTYHFSG